MTDHELTTHDLATLESVEPVAVFGDCLCGRWSYQRRNDDGEAQELVEFEFARHAAGLSEGAAAP